MTKRILPTPEQLRELLRYEPDTGKLFWKERPAEMFKTKRGESIWKAKYAGKQAFTASLGGYKQGMIFGKTYYAHRVAWAIYHGKWPSDQVDHKNCERSDNRIENLRSASLSQNNRNCKISRANTSGLKGVSWSKMRGKWNAKICVDRRQKNLGFFDSKQEAYNAYCRASAILHDQFGRVI